MNLPALTTIPVVDPGAADGVFALLWLVIALPLAGAAILLVGGPLAKGRLDPWGHLLGAALPIGSFLLSVAMFVALLGRGEEERQVGQHLFTWFQTPTFDVGMDLLYDPLAALFLLLITGVGSLIHVYSIAYMEHDPRRRRFFGYLNLFVASMLMLVLSANYVGLFLGWEGVGLASYLLIGFWQHKHSAAAAAKKAFVINRVGDIGLSLAIALLFVTFGTTSFAEISAVSGDASQNTLTALGLLLLLAACGKSAQVPLQAWLLDAMEGPTPVSALIHAATMVTAGVYLIVRSNFIYDLAPDAQTAVVVVGTVTIFWGAFIGCAKDDIKKALAGSTMSQIGYMILAAGLGPAGYAFAIFHLLTHGFFKANMFLGAGSVMHAMDDDVDMRHYGLLRQALPITFLTFLMGYLAIIGIPPFSGFWSKDKIIETALDSNLLVGLCALLGAGVTGFYMTRLMLMTYFTDKRWEKDVHPHESPKVMTVPAHRAGRALRGRRDPHLQRLDRGLPRAGRRRGGPPRPEVRADRRLDRRPRLWSRSAPTIAWFTIGNKPVPREAPQDVSFATRAARRDLYGDDINETLVVGPGRSLVGGVDHLGPGRRRRRRRGWRPGRRRHLEPAPAGPERLRALLRPVHPRGRAADRARPPGGELLVNDFPWLTALILVPLVGALVAAGLPQTHDGALVKRVGLGFALLTALVGVGIATQYDAGSGLQLTEVRDWIKPLGVHYALGVDGLGLMMVLLTVVLVPVVLLASWRDTDEPAPLADGSTPATAGRSSSTNAFVAWTLALEGFSLAVFAATDVFLFYVVFEATLIPAYFLIGGFGRAGRSRAAVKFLVYQLAGGLIMLGSVIGLYVVSARAGSPTYLLTELSRDGHRPDHPALALRRLLHRVRDQGADVPRAHLAGRHDREGHARAPRCS